MKDQIKNLCLKIKLINQTINKQLEKHPPRGFMPPEKRIKILEIIDEIEKLVSE